MRSNDLPGTALAYAQRGWSVIPLRPEDKRPLLDAWASFQTDGASEDQVREWWARHPQANLGIVTGAVSGIVVLDLDGSEGLETVQQLVAAGHQLPHTVRAITPGKGGGSHLFFRHPGGTVPNRAHNIPGLPGCDVRGDGGYVLVAPSVHPEGGVYRWAPGCAPGEVELAEIPSWLLDALQAAPAGWAGDGTPGAWFQGVPEGQRNDSAARLAGRWLAKGLEPEEVGELLLLWNVRNQPPLPEEEIRQVARSIAAREATKPAGEGTPAPVFAQPLSALLAQEDRPIAYLATGLLEVGAIGFVGGEPKLGKSWLGLHMALAVATGTPVLGTYPVPSKDRVLYIQEEDGPDLIRRRIRLLCAGQGIPEPEDACFRVAVRTGFKINDPRWCEALRKELVAFRPALILVDVLNKVHTADENDQQEMTHVMSLFEGLRREFGCAFLLVHHFRKSGGEGSMRGNQRLRGSGVLGGWSECSFYLSPMQNGAIQVEHESKNPTLEPFAFRLEDVKDTEGTLVAVRLAYQGAAVVLQQADKLNAMLGTVQEAHAEGGASLCTAKALADRAEVSENTVRAQLRLLEDAGKVRQVKIRPGGQGRPVTAYLPAEAADPAGEDGSATHPPRGDELMKHVGAPQEGGSSAQKAPFELSHEAGEGVARG